MAETVADEDLTGAIGAEPVCERCGSNDVVRDAWAAWNPETGLWDLSQVFDDGYCRACEETAQGFAWRKRAVSRTETIRKLNDALRTGQGGDGIIVITPGIQALGPDFIHAARAAVAAFSEFTPDNDPHLEHDFGALDVSGERVFFKIDPYDIELKWHTPDAADPAVTRRVLTIMLSHEY